MASDLSTPEQVIARLEAIDTELAQRQNAYESAAFGWYTARREIEKAKATALLTAEDPSVTEKKARGALAAYVVDGAEHEAEYEALRAVIAVLTTRSTIGMAILKSQGRGA